MTTPAIEPAREGRFVLLLGALVAFGPLAIDLYLPALPAIGAGLSASAETVQLSITVFLAGFSLGMLFYGPISDRYGRRTVMLTGIALFSLASLGCMLATSVDQLIAARFVQALGGGAASVLARAVVRDVYTPTEAIRKLSLMAMVTGRVESSCFTNDCIAAVIRVPCSAPSTRHSSLPMDQRMMLG